MDEPDDPSAAIPDPYSVIYGAIEALPVDQAPAGRVIAIRAIEEQLVEFPPSEREHFIQKLREKTGVPISALRGDIERLERDLRRNEREREREANRAPAVDFYRTTPGGLVWDRPTTGGVLPVPLTSFEASIAGIVRQDDGATTKLLLELKTKLDGEVRTLLLTPQEFATMNWPVAELGPKAIVYAGFGIRDHARVAIQRLSPKPNERRQYVHLGWTRLPNGISVYLHAEGAIGPSRPSRPGEIEIALPQNFGRYIVPPPPSGEELVAAVRGAIGLLDLGPARVMFPLFASIFAAVLGRTDFAIHLAGPTGVYKSECAALVQQFFGPTMDARNLPGSWSSTANALEALAFTAKDAVFVVDDFAPTPADRQRLQRDSDRLIRAAGNQLGRQRMRADTSLNVVRHPRSLIISTGEEIPGGVSLRARMLILELSPGEIELARLSECQRLARGGVFARSLAAFIQWAAGTLDELRKRIALRAVELRDASGLTHHARTHAASGQLLASFEAFLDFATIVGGTVEAEAQVLRARCESALGEAIEAQAHHVQSADPVVVFQRLLRAAIAAGYAYVTDGEGKEPVPTAKALGWRVEQTANGENSVLRPKGDRVGWCVDDSVFLNLTAAYRVAQHMGDEGDRLAITSLTLSRRLAEKGLLRSRDENRHKNVVREWLEGAQRTVLHLPLSFLVELDRDEAAQDPPSSGNSAAELSAENGAKQAYQAYEPPEAPGNTFSHAGIPATYPVAGPPPCYSCGEIRLWRFKATQNWLCTRCHPNVHPPDAIEIWPAEGGDETGGPCRG